LCRHRTIYVIQLDRAPQDAEIGFGDAAVKHDRHFNADRPAIGHGTIEPTIHAHLSRIVRLMLCHFLDNPPFNQLDPIIGIDPAVFDHLQIGWHRDRMQSCIGGELCGDLVRRERLRDHSWKLHLSCL